MRGRIEVREAAAAANGAMVLRLEGGHDAFRVDASKGRTSYASSYLGARAFNRALVAFEKDAGVTAGDVTLQGANGDPATATWHDIATLNAVAPVAEAVIAYAWVRLSVASYTGAGDIRAVLTLRND